jgi:hypothetical protein
MTLAFQGYAIATTAASSSAAMSVSGRRQGNANDAFAAQWLLPFYRNRNFNMSDDHLLIKVRYSSVDGYRENRSKSPARGRAFRRSNAVRGRGLLHRCRGQV